MNNNSKRILHDVFASGDFTWLSKIHDMPSHIIKFFNGAYFGNNNCYLDAISKNELWLSSPYCFNDPFDCAINIDFKKNIYDSFFKWTGMLFAPEAEEGFFNNADVIRILDMFAQADAVRYEEKAKAFKDMLFISCFSEKSNLRSLRMWGHYANSHKGFCAEYNLVKVLRLSKNILLPVVYSNSYILDFKAKNSSSQLRQFFSSYVYTKALEWEYEKEWRLCCLDENNSGKQGYFIPFITPDKIYLGCKIENKLKKQIIDICQKNNVDVFQMCMEPMTYNLSYRQLGV